MGPMPSKILANMGIKVIITQGDVHEAIRKSKSSVHYIIHAHA